MQRSLLPLAWACLALIPLSCATQAVSRTSRTPERPNILFVFADDQRADTIATLGNSRIRTPNLDRIVRGGFRFSRAYCMGSPHGAVCVPSRAMVQSGISLHRVPLDLDGVGTMPEVLREAGYTTFATGKWHNGQKSFARMWDHGRTVMFGGMCDHTQVPIRDMLDDHSFTEVKTGEGFSSTMFAQAAIDFLRSHDGDEPFLAYVALTAPHDPRQAPPEYLAMYDPDDMVLPANYAPQHPFDNGQMTTRDEKLGAWPRTPELIRSQTAEYYALITHMDRQVGRILKALEETGHADDTIVIYAADHGLAMGSHGLLGKQSLYEHSMHAPLVFSGPGIPAGESDAFVYLFDILPTVCGLTGARLPDTAEGHDLGAHWRGEARAEREVMFTSYGKLMRAVRDDRWKLIRYPQIDRTQLFDLRSDPHETEDLAGQARYQEQEQRLTERLKAAQATFGDTQPLSVAEPKSDEIDLAGRERQPDRWQPQWIVEKYFRGS